MNYVIAAIRKDGYLLQGLIGLPLGLWTLGSTVPPLLWPLVQQALGGLLSLMLLPLLQLTDEPLSFLSGLLSLMLLPLMIVGRNVIKRSYQRKGALPRSMFENAVIPWAIVLGLVALSWGFGLAVSLEWGIAVQGVWLGLALLIFGHRFWTHIAFGIVLVLAGLALPFALSGTMNYFDITAMMYILLGCAIIVGSIYEHVVFVRRGDRKRAAS